MIRRDIVDPHSRDCKPGVHLSLTLSSMVTFSYIFCSGRLNPRPITHHGFRGLLAMEVKVHIQVDIYSMMLFFVLDLQQPDISMF
jgi:hypothetical protein